MKLKNSNDICTTNISIYLFNKENDTWRTQLHEGTPTMAPRNLCKQARVIDTNQIQSKTQQPDKILNHRDLIEYLIGMA